MTTLTIWKPDHTSGIGGDIDPIHEWTKTLHAHGAVIAELGERPWNHRVIGCGLSHDDAKFAETGDSMAAYYENDEPYGGRWMDNERIRARYYETG